MNPNRMEPTRYRSLDATKKALLRAAPLVRYGLFAVGVSMFMDQVKPLISDAQYTWGEQRVMMIVAVVTVGGFGVAGWVAGLLLRAAAELVDVLADMAEAASRSAYLIEGHVVPALARVSVAMERLGEVGTQETKAKAASQAIEEGRWGRAEQLIKGLPKGEADRLAIELAKARQTEFDDLRARLDAAKAVGDAGSVVDCRDALTQYLRGQALADLDRRLVRWLSDLINAKASSGPVSPELANLAARTADSFGDSDEGAALLAALPTLRRRAGLCPNCARPYRGKADVCPDCSTQLRPTSRAIPKGAS